MALSVTAQLGAAPDPRTLAFRAYAMARIEYLYSYCNQPRTNTYYISESTGLDSNNGTSPSTPWKTIAKAQTAIQTANTAVLFECGNEWNETVGLSSAANNITVGSYGTGQIPSLNAFSGKIVSGWTLTTGTTWQVAAVANVGIFRLTGNALPQTLTGLSPYFTSRLPANRCHLWAANSLAACEAAVGSWYFNSSTNVIYFNTGNSGAAPPPCEYIVTGTLSGINLSGDGCLIQRVRADGWGASGVGGAGGQSEQLPILSTAQGTNAVCIDGCETFYSDDHLIGHLAEGATASGGITLYRGNRFGLCAESPSGSISLIDFAQEGGQEAWGIDNVQESGSWPVAGTPPASGYYSGVGQAMYCHAAATYTVGFMCMINTRLEQNSRCVSKDNSGTGNGATPTGNWTGYNVFFIGTRTEKRTEGLGLTIGCPLLLQSTGAMYIGCKWDDQFAASSVNGYMSTNYLTGRFFDCDLSFTSEGANAAANLSGNGGPTLIDLAMEYCRLTLKGNWYAGNSPGLQTQLNAGSTYSVRNCLLQSISSAAYFAFFSFGTASNMVADNNAYAGAAWANSMDTAAINLVGTTEDEAPISGSLIYQKGIAFTDGVSLEYDIDWNPRNLVTPNIGPREVNPGFTVTQAQTVKFGYETGRTLTFRSYTQGSSPTLVQTISLTESPAGSSNYVTSTALTLGTPITYTITDSVSGVVGTGVM